MNSKTTSVILADFKPGTYYELTSQHDEKTIAYYYLCPDAKAPFDGSGDPDKDYSDYGFGFNVADGGGFVPANDITYKSIRELEFETAGTSTEWKKRADFLWGLLDNIDTAFDMYKFSVSMLPAGVRSFVNLVQKQIAKRFEISSSDGYEISYKKSVDTEN